MSTNYYAFGPDITDPEGLHIGQFTVTSRFLLQSIPERGLTTFAAWMEFLRQPAVIIRDEYGSDIDLAEMEDTIRERTDSRGRPKRARITRPFEAPPGYHVDPQGFEFCEHDFF